VLRTVHSLRRIWLRQWLRLSAFAVGLALLTCLVPLIHQLMPLVRAAVIWVMSCTATGQVLHCHSTLYAIASKLILENVLQPHEQPWDRLQGFRVDADHTPRVRHFTLLLFFMILKSETCTVICRRFDAMCSQAGGAAVSHSGAYATGACVAGVFVRCCAD
jgi:hypothetical protein